MRRAILLFCLVAAASPLLAATGYKVVAWNDLGMHCTDGTDYSVYGILPPYNTIHAQVIDPNGRLVRDGSSIKVTYEAVADATGSINTTSTNKTNFWTWSGAIFGASPAPDTGLTGNAMPGSANTPQPMTFDATASWFTADGIPITPYDDAGAKNYYPMMRVVVRNSSGIEVASTKIVLPVSDEMDCRSCHGPANVPIGARETKLDVLRVHDARNAGPAYNAALSRAGYKPEGLLATSQSGSPILCARCHASNALPGTGLSGIPPLTQSIHAFHAPFLPNSNRDACYRCHPGASTKCLRGAMGRSVQPNGALAIQCQDCHGGMSAVGRTRTGWLDEPTCQSCHTGNAITNSGAIRFTSVFVADDVTRAPSLRLFATNDNVPAPGFTLFRFSRGHGGLYCEACHGSTHAELPSSHDNDNVQAIALQGHTGVISECTACHPTTPTDTTGGPHGMHPVGATWVSRHGDIAEHSSSQCQACHGSDYRGTVLTRALGPRSISTQFGAKNFWRGYRISCYACHNGPGSESATKVQPPSVNGAAAITQRDLAVGVTLQANDAGRNPLTLHIVDPPQHGTAGIDGTRATYIPEPGFIGRDTFTYAAWNGYVESQLATVSVDVGAAGAKRRAVRR